GHDAPRRRRAAQHDGLPVRQGPAMGPGTRLPDLQPRHGAAVARRRQPVRPRQRAPGLARVPLRQQFIQLPRCTTLQGQVQAGMDWNLPGLSARRLGPGPADRHCRAGVRWVPAIHDRWFLSATAAAPRRLATWQAIGALFALIAIIRIGMVLAFAPAFPFIDEWEAVVVGMAKPLRHGQFDPAYLLASYNGHPLLWTKLISLFFLRLDGLQFDNVPVCVFNQIVYAL